MRRVGLFCLCLAVSPLWAGSSPRVLVPERRTSLHVGETAVLRIPSKPHYIVREAGDSLTRNGRQGAEVFYRARKPGLETLVLAPVNLPKRHCASCITRHYFITAVPQR